ncbi:MAG: DUF4897 domain-containing protein [Candidatus Bathyarchaeia archaeon]
MRKTKLSINFFLVFLIFSFTFGVAFCEIQLEESRLVELEVESDGSATWTITHRYSLKTEDDVKIFQLYLSEFESKKEEYLKLFSDNMHAMVNRASNITGRNMTAKNFEVNADILQTPTGSVGFTKYQGIWVGFALVENSRIQIGDVFDVGFFLFENTELTIKYPQGYQVIEVRPTPDLMMDHERTLVWYGPRSFGAEEPMVLLEKRVVGIIDVLQTYWATVGLATISFSLGIILFYRFNKKRKEEAKKVTPQIIQELESDEDKVVRLLKMMGGKACQSIIQEKCGFSSSKTSQLLKNMENAGIVRREKRGREKLVILLQSEGEAFR